MCTYLIGIDCCLQGELTAQLASQPAKKPPKPARIEIDGYYIYIYIYI